MAVDVAVIQQAVSTGTGTQDFTSSGFGTPKAAWFWLTRGVTNGTAVDHCCSAVGACDATRQWVGYGMDEHGVGTMNNQNRGMSDECLALSLTSSAAVDGEMNFNSFITDGVRLSIGDAFANAYLATVILFGGSDLSVYCDADTHTTGTTQSFTGAGFRPDVILFGGHGRDFNDTSNGWASFSCGAAVDDGSLTQGAFSWASEDGLGTSNTYSRVDNNRVYAEIADSGSWNSLELSAFEANGFELTLHDGVSNFDFGYLALEFNGEVQFDLNHFTSPTSTGSLARTAFGFKPQFVALFPSFCDTVNASETVGSQGAGSWAASSMDSSTQVCNNVSVEDGVGTADTQSLTHNRPVYVARDTGTVVFDATFTSFDTNGYTLNFATTDGTARQWFELGIEENAGAAGLSIPVAMANYRKLRTPF